MKQILSLTIFTFLFCLSTFAQTENQPCPIIEITPLDSVAQTGERVFFSVSVSAEVKNYDVKYKWSVDKGTIVNGQNTTIIQLATEGLSDTTITVTFEIEGLPKNCESKISDNAAVAGRIGCKLPADEYNDIPLLEELQRLDSFLVQLEQNSDSTGFVWITIDEKENIESAKNHIETLVKHIKFRKFAKERIIFGVEKSDNHLTRLIIVPEGAELPECGICEIFKGRDLK